jgi:hypothetical protein
MVRYGPAHVGAISAHPERRGQRANSGFRVVGAGQSTFRAARNSEPEVSPRKLIINQLVEE